jgi:hypothetical protein
VFWTIPVPPESLQVDLLNGTGSFHVVDIAVPDYGKIPNGLRHGTSSPATVSFDIEWRGVTGRSRVNNTAGGYTAELVTTGATIAWSARQDGFTFTSDPASTSKVTDVTMIGHERNGVYTTGASTEWPPLAVNGQSTTDGKTVTFSYIVANLSATDVGSVDVRARVPVGSAVVDSWFSQPGRFPGANNGFDVVWAEPVTTIAAGSSVGPFSITVNIPPSMQPSQVQSIGWAGFQLPTAGDAVSGWIGGG